MLHVACAAVALCEPADAGQENNDPYDWSDHTGEVILDDPEFFISDEESLDENKPEPESGEETQAQQGGDTQEENEEQPADSPAENPSQEEPGEQASQPSETPDDPEGESGEDSGQSANEPAEQTDDPAARPEQPADLKSLFLVEIKVPAGWFNLPEKAARVKITPQGDALWSKIQYRMDDGEWTEIRERFSFQDGYYFYDLTVNANCSLAIRLLNDAGEYFDTHKEIRIFDHQPPEVTAGIKNTMLHVEAKDDLSEVAGIQVNGLLFTTLEDGVLDVRMEEPLNTYRQLAIRAYDYAGNFSNPVTLDNPYFVEPTPTPKPTKKPAVTQKPAATDAPTPTTKPTKKPSGSGSGNTSKEADEAKPTKAPAATAAPEKQEPIVIILTPLPTTEPAPTP